MLRTCVALAIVTAITGGCLQGSLRVPVEDHRIQTATIAEMCRSGGYGEACPDTLQADLDAMAEQAELLDAIVKSKKPGAPQ
jgi:hypothetical protein